MRLFYGLVLTVVVSASARAPPADRRWPLAEAVAEALSKNPAIAAAQNRYEAARQRPAQERALPDPTISAGYTAAGNPLPGAGLGTEAVANIGFMVSQELPYPGKRDLRASIASREADADRLQIDGARLDVTARVEQAYYRLSYAYAAADVLTRSRDLLDTLRQVSESRYAVGQAAQQDVIKAQTQISVLDLQLERIRQERATREGELNALLARAPGTPVPRPEDLPPARFDSQLDALVTAANAHAPMLRRDDIMVDRARLGVEAAKKDYRPDFAVAAGYYSMGALPPMYQVRFDVKVPLQRTKRDAAVAEQSSTVEAARHAADVTRLGLQDQVQADFHAAATSARLASLYQDAVLPQARLALESSIASYQTGRVDFLSVVTNFGTVLEYELRYFDELASYHISISRLEQTTGTPMVH